MSSDEIVHAPWQREFFKAVDSFESHGMDMAEARDMLREFLRRSADTPMPPVMESFQSAEALSRVGVRTEPKPEIREFMMRFLRPLMHDFTVEGTENLDLLRPLMDRFPVTLISNHLSHLDAPSISYLLNEQGGIASDLAARLSFIAGRLAFEPDFTRLGLYMLDTLLVCSQRDMQENPAQADLMTRINMRSFRMSRKLRKAGRVIVIFPEGTRSRSGRMMQFVDAAYHYIANSIILPIALEGTEKIFPTNSFRFKLTAGKMIIGKPVLAGTLSAREMTDLPDEVQRIVVPDYIENGRRYMIDALALLIGSGLHRHRHGTYRNLYLSEIPSSKASSPGDKILIQRKKKTVRACCNFGAFELRHRDGEYSGQ